jgi:hypothetical protein
MIVSVFEKVLQAVVMSIDEAREYGLATGNDGFPTDELLRQLIGGSQGHNAAPVNGQHAIIENCSGVIHRDQDATVNYNIN